MKVNLKNPNLEMEHGDFCAKLKVKISQKLFKIASINPDKLSSLISDA